MLRRPNTQPRATVFLPTDSLVDFQVSVTCPEDLGGLDTSVISSIFVRSEHLLYAATAEGNTPSTLNGMSLQLQNSLERFRELLPHGCTVLFRGADIRSDDKAFGFLMRKSERNPELGVHGIRALLRQPEWVKAELAALTRSGLSFRYALPFVTNLSEYGRFVESFEAPEHGEFVPFLESPGALDAAYRSPHLLPEWVCIGMKDLAQFYFAADRSNPDLDDIPWLTDADLISFVCERVQALAERGHKITIYQTLETLPLYLEKLGVLNWSASMSVSDVKDLELQRKMDI